MPPDSRPALRPGRTLFAALTAAAMLLLTACQTQVAGTPLPALGEAPGAETPAAAGGLGTASIGEALPAGLAEPSPGWLILAYQAAGNDLESAILGDVHEALSTTDPNVRVLSLLDRSPRADGDGGYSDAESLPGIPEGPGTQLITMVAGQGQLVADLPDLPMSDPQTLADFVAAGIRAFPAAKVALVIADHGAGRVGAAVDEVAEAAGQPALLDLPAILNGISSGLQQAGRASFDLIGFDACLMAEWDVALALAPFAERLVASAETEPGEGWDWTYLAGVTADDSADRLGEKIVDHYGDFYQETRAGQTSTISMIDLTQIQQLDVALSFLSAVTVVGGTDEELAWLARARASAWEYGRSADPESDARLVDLGAWADILAQSGGTLGDAARELRAALDRAVIAQWAGPGTEGTSGLSVYLPPSDATTDPNYRDIGGDTLWAEFLADFHRRIGQLDISPGFVGLTAPELTGLDTDKFSAAAQFNPDARGLVVAGALRLGGVQPDGRIDFLRSAPVEMGDDAVQGWDEFGFFQVTDGAVGLPVYLDQERATGIPYWYSSSGSDPVPIVVRIADTGDGTYAAVDAVATLPGSTTASRAVLDPNGVLWPRFRTAAPDGTDTGWTQGQGGAVLSADLTRHVYRFGDIPSGSQVAVQFGLLLANGEEMTTTSLVTVP